MRATLAQIAYGTSIRELSPYVHQGAKAGTTVTLLLPFTGGK